MKSLFLVVALAASIAVPARAGLDGTTVSVEYNIPTLGIDYPFAIPSPADFVVGPGIDSVVDVEGVTWISVDFTNNGLALLFNTSLGNPTWNSADFNGLVFSGTGFTTVTGLTILSGSTFGATNPSALEFSLVGDELRLDWGGVSYHDGDVLYLGFADLHGDVGVPEPATWAMFIAGFGLVGVSLRRRAAGSFPRTMVSLKRWR